MTNHAIEQQLDLLATSLEHNQYPGYPSREDRLVIPLGELATMDHLPDGPWNTTPDSKPMHLHHPWIEPMISRPDVGVLTGRGVYWRWGPNFTADAIVVHDEHVLLIQRQDTGLWALPGGFIDNHEPPLVAARREVLEETGVELTEADEALEVYRGPVVDLRATAHAWPETTAFLFTPQERGEAIGADDAQHAEWIPLERALGATSLFGAHNFLLRQVVSRLTGP